MPRKLSCLAVQESGVLGHLCVGTPSGIEKPRVRVHGIQQIFFFLLIFFHCGRQVSLSAMLAVFRTDLSSFYLMRCHVLAFICYTTFLMAAYVHVSNVFILSVRVKFGNSKMFDHIASRTEIYAFSFPG